MWEWRHQLCFTARAIGFFWRHLQGLRGAFPGVRFFHFLVCSKEAFPSELTSTLKLLPHVECLCLCCIVGDCSFLVLIYTRQGSEHTINSWLHWKPAVSPIIYNGNSLRIRGIILVETVFLGFKGQIQLPLRFLETLIVWKWCHVLMHTATSFMSYCKNDFYGTHDPWHRNRYFPQAKSEMVLLNLRIWLQFCS